MVASPFQRLARVHALSTAGDVAMVVSLAGSLFFSISPDAARGKVLLYLLVSFAPFALVAPFIGPVVDRAAPYRKYLVMGTGLGRAALFVAMIYHLDDLLLFPLSFGVMVLQKTYGVARAALVPAVVRTHDDLVEANSKLGLIGGMVGAVGAAPAGLLSAISPRASLGWGAIVFLVMFAAATALPRQPGVSAESPSVQRELRQRGLVAAARCATLLRAAVGFLFFEVLFWLREEHFSTFWIGAAIAASSLGLMTGNAVAPLARLRLREPVMLVASGVAIAVAGVAATVIGGPGPAVGLAAVVNCSSAFGRMAFDSIVQRSAPDADHGRAFARFETRFQLAWAIAGAVPLAYTFPGRLGFAAVGAIGVAAVLWYGAARRVTPVGSPRDGRSTTRGPRSRPASATRRDGPATR